MPYGVQCVHEAESSGNVTAIIRPGRPCGRQASEHEGVWCIILHAPDCLQWRPPGGSLAALIFGDCIISQLTLAL